MRLPAVLHSVMAFGAVGLAATAMHAVIGLTLTGLGWLRPFNANIIAFSLAFLVSYVGHRRFSFRSRVAHRRALPRFLSVAAFGLMLNQLIVYGVVTLAGYPYAAALVLLVTVVPAGTYVLSRFWAFRAPETP